MKVGILSRNQVFFYRGDEVVIDHSMWGRVLHRI